MCNPSLIITGALMAGSMVANRAAQNKVTKARNSANSAESIRQEDFRRQQAAMFEDTSAPFNRADQEAGIDEAAASREDSLIGNLKALSPGDIPTAGSAPQVVRDNLAKELNRSLGEGKDFATRLARLGAPGENQLTNSFGLLRGAQDQDRLGSFSRGSSNILPLEFQAANRRGDSLSTLGSVLGSLGSVTSGIAATGGFSPNTPPFAGPLGQSGPRKG